MKFHSDHYGQNSGYKLLVEAVGNILSKIRFGVKLSRDFEHLYDLYIFTEMMNLS